MKSVPREKLNYGGAKMPLDSFRSIGGQSNFHRSTEFPGRNFAKKEDPNKSCFAVSEFMWQTCSPCLDDHINSVCDGATRSPFALQRYRDEHNFMRIYLLSGCRRRRHHRRRKMNEYRKCVSNTSHCLRIRRQMALTRISRTLAAATNSIRFPNLWAFRQIVFDYTRSFSRVERAVATRLIINSVCISLLEN